MLQYPVLYKNKFKKFFNFISTPLNSAYNVIKNISKIELFITEILYFQT